MSGLIFDIATAPSGNSKKWKNKKMKWTDFVAKISEPYHTNESVVEFFKMTKDEQAQVKDVGAYFGGYIRSGRRLKANILHRQLVTLDLDFANEYFWEDFTTMYACASLVHGTHKWLEESPRLRLVIPLDREVTPDEYTAISRRIAGNVGIDLFDPTTFDTNRFMYWQSTPNDMQYYIEVQEGAYLEADNVLAEYIDWTDINEHPRTKDEKEQDRTIADKAENPLTKKGMIGYFCRTYSISEAIEKFLPETYEITEYDANRYTFKGGTTHGGAIVYDDLFIYSHHSTDPICNRLANVYDLVSLHLFEGSSESEMQKKMEEFILADDDVKRTIALEKLSAVDDFEGIDLDDEPIDVKQATDWMKDLEADRFGKYLPTAGNLSKIIKNDVRLKDVFKFNIFSSRTYVMRSPAWRKIDKPETIKNVDYVGMRTYMERIYGISSPQKVEDCMVMEADRNKYHPVKDYLNGLVWDSKDRISELFPHWLGADDSEYTRAVTRCFLRGAVSRIFNAGNKFDYVLTFVGEQGAGKSVLASKLGGDWFSDTLMTIKGKEGLEALQGYWIVEMAELSGLKKSDLESQKHYIAKTKDSYRPAYGRVMEDFLRQNVFIATTNDDRFLKDMTGNRRFLPIRVNKGIAMEHPFDMEQAYIDQIWGQAMYIYNEMPYEDIPRLSDEQEDYLEEDPRTSMLFEFLDIMIPKDFYEMGTSERMLYFSMNTYLEPDKNRMLRTQISPIEVFVELFQKDSTIITRLDVRSIRDMLSANKDWEYIRQARDIKGYGKQRPYKRKISTIKLS